MLLQYLRGAGGLRSSKNPNFKRIAIKNLLLVKLIVSLLVLGLHVQANVSAQVITLRLKQVSLAQAFKAIHRQTGVNFLYTDDVLINTKTVSISCHNKPFEIVLKQCFDGQPVGYQFISNTVVVLEKENSGQANSRDTLIDVRGQVISENKPVVGASVSIVGASKGASTDGAGRFTLHGISTNAQLIFTSVGFQSLQLSVAGRTMIEVTLHRAINNLDETVIIGYGTTTRRLNTGNIGKVGSADIARQPVTNVLQAMQGRVPGLFVRETQGVPGSAMTVQLRGLNSIASSNNPFYLIDGVPFEANTPSVYLGGATGIDNSPFNILNPSEIESIEVLKDADATAIYGSRGANGVILITTKKGAAGKTRVGANVYTGTGRITRTMPLLNTQQYLEIRHEAFAGDQATPQFFDYDINGSWDTTRYTDWQKVLIGHNAPVTNAQVSLSGGSDRAQFLIGGGYQHQGTVMPGEFAEDKTSVHARFTNRSNDDRLKTDFSVSYAHVASDLPQSSPISYLLLPPDAPALYSADGKLNWQNNTWRNPMANFNQVHQATSQNIRASMDLNYSITEDIDFKVSAGWTSMQFSELLKTPKTYYNPAVQSLVQNVSQFSDNDQETWIIEPQINYKKQWGKGQFNALAGASIQHTKQGIHAVMGTGYALESLMGSLASASTITSIGDNQIQYKYAAAFGRISYRFEDKYIVNLTGRRDGSSRFGPGRQFANFYAAGAAWIFSKESFFTNIPWMSFGKLRASYGTAGNDGISDYGFLNTYQPTIEQYLGVTGLSPIRLANPDYAWELNRKFEAGIETGFNKDRLLFSVSYYRNKSSNQLVGYSLPGATGFRSIQANLPAKVENTGVEFELTLRNIITTNFQWVTALNGTFPSNKLIRYPGLAQSGYADTYEEGKSLFIQRLFHYEDVDPNTGIHQFEDIDHNGSIDYPQDLRGVKKRAQAFYGGMQNTFSYKGFECSIFIQFVKQTDFNYLYTSYRVPGTLGNQPSSVLNRWRRAGDRTNTQLLTQDGGSVAAAAYYTLLSSDAIIGDASFARLKNLSLSYSFAPALIKMLKMQLCKIYFQAQNLYTFTHYNGWDPETYGQIPPLKTLTAGIQLTL